MKKLLIMSIALVAIMATVFTVSAFAANTVEITGVTLSKYYDTAEVEGVTTRTFNDAYANVTVNYTVTEDTPGSVDRLTFYLAAQDLTSALEGEEAKVIYIDETVNPNAESFTFVIEKDRVRTAFTSAEKIDSTLADAAAHAALNAYSGPNETRVSPFEMTFKLGGTNIDVADDYKIVFKNPTMFGDASGDGKVNVLDAVMILKHNSKIEFLENDRFVSGDASGDGKVNVLDSVYVLKFNSKLVDYNEFLAKRTWNY